MHISARTINKDGEPWFVAKDVAEILGYADTDQAIRKHCKCPEIFKPVESTGLVSGPRGITIIPERDVYRLVNCLLLRSLKTGLLQMYYLLSVKLGSMQYEITNHIKPNLTLLFQTHTNPCSNR